MKEDEEHTFGTITVSTRSSITASTRSSISGNGRRISSRVGHNDDHTYRPSHRVSMRESIAEVPKPQLPERHKRAVRYSKLLFIFVLLLSCLCMATVTFNTIAAREYANFKGQFDSYASGIIAVSSEKVHRSFKAIEGFSAIMTSYALDTNREWPYVIIPHYSTRAASVAEQVDATRITFAPLVYEEFRTQFELSSRSNLLDVYQEAITYNMYNNHDNYTSNKEDINKNGDAIDAQYIADTAKSYVDMTEEHIFRRENFENFKEMRPGPWPVLWQTTPFSSNSEPEFFPMYNIYATPMLTHAYFMMVMTKMKTTAVVELESNKDMEFQVFQPIFETLYTTDSNIATNKVDSRKLVGVVWAIIDLKGYFSSLLPENVNGIVLVIESTCVGASVTYEINGQEAILVGKGDLHDPHYNEFEVVANLVTLEDEIINSEIGIPEGRCIPEVTIHLFPSDTLRQQFKSKNPLLCLGGVLLIFFFIIVAYIISDIMIERRQKAMDDIVAKFFLSRIKDHSVAFEPSLFHDDEDMSMF